MEKEIVKLEEEFCDSYQAIPEKLKLHYESLMNIDDVNLDTTIISRAILTRLIAYYSYQNKIKEFLNKRYIAPGADFFVETVLFYLKFIIDKYNLGLEVCSEKAIERKRGAIRPDISIWKGDKVIAIIECKTQLGWNRLKWEEDFIKRETLLKSKFPNAKAYLLVMSLANRGGFEGSPNNKYFALSKYWPGELSKATEEAIEMPIEALFNDIIPN